MSAFSVFFLQSPSFLAHQERMSHKYGTHNGKNLFDFDHIPSDNQIRNVMDGVDPKELTNLFSKLQDIVFEIAKDRFVTEDGLLIALDGTEFFSSDTISCSCCLQKKVSKVSDNKKGDKKKGKTKSATIQQSTLIDQSIDNNKVRYYHSALCPVVIHPNQSYVLPMMPEFINHQDGAIKQDCEINAAKRWCFNNKDWLEQNRVTLIADDLYSRTPFCKQILALKNVNFILVCKPQSHSYMQEWLGVFEEKDWYYHKTTESCGNKKRVFNYKFYNDVPLSNDQAAPLVNYLEMTVSNSKGLSKNNFPSYISQLQ